MLNNSISQTTAADPALYNQSVSKPQNARAVEESAQQEQVAQKAPSSSRPDTAQISAQARALAASEGGASSNDVNNRQQRVDERRQPEREQAQQQGQQVQQQRLDVVV